MVAHAKNSGRVWLKLDPASGQSFAQAYDNVATALRTSQPAPVQPWFENQLPGLATQKNAANATAYVVAQNQANFTSGNVFTIFQNLGTYRRALGDRPAAVRTLRTRARTS